MLFNEPYSNYFNAVSNQRLTSGITSTPNIIKSPHTATQADLN